MFRRLLMLWLLLLPVPTLAQQNWSLSGFGSLAAGRVEDGNLEFQGYNADEWSFDGDSVLGLQLNLDLAERLSLTAQVVARGHNWDDTGSYEPELDWLFTRYQLSDAWRVRLGRMRTPLYLYSETIGVGYSYVWARPPTDVYAPTTLPFSNFDGADLAYISDWGDVGVDIQLLGGVMSRSRDALHIDVDPLLGGNITLHGDDLTLRYGLLMLNTDVVLDDLDEVTSLYETAGALIDPAFAEVANQFSAEDNWYRYQALGLRWDSGNFSAISEVFDIYNTDEGYTNNAQGWYLSLQYRIDQVTPYIVRGNYTNEFGEDALSALQDTYAIWPEGQTIPIVQTLVDQLDQLRAETAIEIQNQNFEQRTWTFGVRYDLHRNVALKAEWQYFDFRSGVSHFTATAPDVSDHTSITTFILDVVF